MVRYFIWGLCLQDFHVDALEKFVEESSVPIVTLFNKDPSNHPFVIKFFNGPNAKVNSSDYRIWKFSIYFLQLKIENSCNFYKLRLWLEETIFFKNWGFEAYLKKVVVFENSLNKLRC